MKHSVQRVLSGKPFGVMSLGELVAETPDGSSVAVARREFLKMSASTGASLLLAFHWPRRWSVSNEDANSYPRLFAPNAWLQVAPSGEVKIWCAKSEMGQGVRTVLPLIVAEELGAEWKRVQIVQGDFNPKYGDQVTGGSYSVRGSYADLRKAGAAAREILLASAEAEWKVPHSECRAENGEVVHATSGRRLAFSRLIARAVLIPPPADPPLKQPAHFSILGKPTPRTDTRVKVNGAAKFGLDVRVPGMLVASVERCPVFGGSVRRFNADKARSVPGVRAVFEVKAVPLTHHFGDEMGADSRNLTRSGIAVVADTTWTAMQARKALEVEWDLGPYAAETTRGLREQFVKLVQQPGSALQNDGDFDAAFASSAKKLEAVYEVPFLAHATMEPLNCTAHVRDDGCELWAPTQIPGAAATSVAKMLGIPVERVTVHVTFLGGGFGRRLIQDYAVEAAQISREVGAPVQVVWTREDDIRHDYYRPASYHAVSAGLDDHGNLIAWKHHAASPSIGVFFRGSGISAGAAAEVNGYDFPAYAVPNFRVEFSRADSGVPVGYWRSVENSGNGFVLSSFLDEAAAAAGRDPVEFLLAMLGPPRKMDLGKDTGVINVARRRRVIELAAEKSGWGKPMPKGKGRGIAAYFGYGSCVAQVAELTASTSPGTLHVDRVICAIDCGFALNPLGVRAQMESAINFGLAAALKSEITVASGCIQQSNFHDYEVLRMSDAPPVIEVHIVPSSDPPGGCGEPGVPPVAGALGNAIYAATGKRARRLPIRLEESSDA